MKTRVSDFWIRLSSELPQLLAASDYVLCVLPSVPSTDGLFDGDVLSHCATKVGLQFQLFHDINKSSLILSVRRLKIWRLIVLKLFILFTRYTCVTHLFELRVMHYTCHMLRMCSSYVLLVRCVALGTLCIAVCM